MSEANLNFQDIYDEYRPKVLRYLTRLVGEFEAEDLTQEVFVRASRALADFRGEAQVSTWIYRIATNLAIDRMRQPSFKREVEQALPDGSDHEAGRADEVDRWTGQPSSTIEQEILRKQGFACFCDFIQQLPQNYRVIVALDQISEFTAKEIADILGLDLEVVKTRLHRGRLKLFQALKAYCKPEDWL